MGLRFRKSVNLGGGVRLNFNKKSTGISFGTKGARYSINSNGRKTASIGIPGTGLYWTESKTKNSKNGNKQSSNSGCLIWILFFPFIMIYYMFKYIIKFTIFLVKKIIEILKGEDEKKKKIVYIGLAIFGFMFVVSMIASIINPSSTETNPNNQIDENVNINNEQNNESNKEIIEYYKDDESINLFINKYNTEYDPDITTDMITKKHIGGRDRDDVVTISNDKLEIIIYGSNKHNEIYSMSVYIGYRPKISSTNDDYKEEFIKYVKLLDETLTDDEISTYWNDMISEYRSSYEINEIDITPNIVNGNVQYFKMTGKVKM